ncbi:MAG: hypothetical protein Q9168_006975 [Polycauliona sp. 1 TL-2023]
MACFDDLPNELLAMILNLVAVADFENFAQINKTVYIVAKKRREEYRRLCRQLEYTCVPSSDLQTTYDLMRTCMDTEQGEYLRNIRVDKSSAWVDRHTPLVPLRLSPEDEDWMLEEVSTDEVFDLLLQTPGYTDVRHKIQRYCQNVLSALLLLYTPNIRRLELSFHFHDCVWLQSIFRHAIHDDSQTVLGNLNSILFYGLHGDPPDIHTVMRIPSVRRLTLESLWKWTSADESSARCPIEILELLHANDEDHVVDAQALRSMLVETTCLNTLDIQCRVFEKDTQPGQLLTWANTLLPVCRTLRNLTIVYSKPRDYERVIHSMGSLKGFIALESLEAQFDAVCPRDLPSSIQSLKLHGKPRCFSAHSEEDTLYSACTFIEAILEGHRSGENCKLKHLEFTENLASNNGRSRETLKEFMTQCAALGIELVAPDVTNNAFATTESTAPS